MDAIKSILIVDDEQDILDEIKSLIHDVNAAHIVHEALDGEIGLSKIKDCKYDLVITDLNMPKLNGKDFISQIKNQPDKHQPENILVISGLFDMERSVSFSKMTTIPKPWDEQLLNDYLKFALGESAEEQKAVVIKGSEISKLYKKNMLEILNEKYNTDFKLNTNLESKINIDDPIESSFLVEAKNMKGRIKALFQKNTLQHIASNNTEKVILNSAKEFNKYLLELLCDINILIEDELKKLSYDLVFKMDIQNTAEDFEEYYFFQVSSLDGDFSIYMFFTCL